MDSILDDGLEFSDQVKMLESKLTGEDGGMAGETAPLSAPLVACY